MPATLTEVRCPEGPRRLFAKLRQDGEKPVVIAGNLIEFACRDCRSRNYLLSGVKPARVLHRFNLAGELIETEVVWDEVSE